MLIRRLLLLLVWLLAAIPAWADVPPHWQMCDGWRTDHCHQVVPERISLTRPLTTLVTTVHMPPDATGQPVAVDIDAMASALVRWNGVVIGANGMPGPNRATEVVGRYSVSLAVPPDLINPGDNRVAITLSAHHLWLPVGQPIHRIAIGARQDAEAYTLRHYLPTLATLALPASTLLVLAALFFAGRIGQPALPVMTVLALVVVQGLAEVSKIAIAYSYPWHLARMVALTGLIAIVGLLLVAMASRLFLRRRAAIVVAAAGVAMLAACLAIDGPDRQSLAMFEIAMVAASAVAVPTAIRRERRAILLALAALSLATWAHIAGPDFLDTGYYVAAAIASFALGLTTVLRPAPVGEVRGATEANEAAILLRDGARHHLVVPSQLLYLKADDDYCGLHMADGRELVVTMTLKAVLALLPSGFVRIHRSYAINSRHLHGTRAGPNGRLAVLTDGILLPIGRAHAAELRSFTDEIALPV